MKEARRRSYRRGKPKTKEKKELIKERTEVCRLRRHQMCRPHRAQDQASMQLSEMEEEMDQRIHAAERKTRDQVGC